MCRLFLINYQLPLETLFHKQRFWTRSPPNRRATCQNDALTTILSFSLPLDKSAELTSVKLSLTRRRRKIWFMSKGEIPEGEIPVINKTEFGVGWRLYFNIFFPSLAASLRKKLLSSFKVIDLIILGRKSTCSTSKKSSPREIRSSSSLNFASTA